MISKRQRLDSNVSVVMDRVRPLRVGSGRFRPLAQVGPIRDLKILGDDKKKIEMDCVSYHGPTEILPS